VGDDGVYRKTGPARVFRTEHDAVAAIKGGRIHAGDVLVLMCRGPMGSGMEEIFSITSALRYIDFGKHVAVITDARFSGVSTGACIGHVTPEALAGGPLGKVREGDLIEIVIDRVRLEGSVNMVVDGSVEAGTRLLDSRPLRDDLTPDPSLPPETRLWAALQDVSGGTWGGCVFDPEAIVQRLKVDSTQR
jgi:dihydroxyacid dehydratase/phosphogluconate dehydratase